MKRDSRKPVKTKRALRRSWMPNARSKLTNIIGILPGVDGRSTWARRFRDLIQAHLSDLGGEDAVSEAERSIIRRAATLTTELERLEMRFALDGEASGDALDRYQRVANSLRRLLESIGLQKRAKNITPDLKTYIASTHSREREAAE